MKKAFIIVTVAGMEDETRNLVRQIKSWRLKDLSVIVIKNKAGEEGYAAGVNKGIKEALKDKAELFFVANPDISLKGIHPKKFFEASRQFDVWGYAMKQDRNTYYGGEINEVRMSGGLIIKKPEDRFVKTDFVSGSLMGFYKDVIDKTGLWDEGFGMYYEDVDFCKRASKEGFGVGIDSDVVYEHHETSKGNPEKEELLAKNRFRFFLKYADVRQTIMETMRLPVTIIEYRKIIWKNIKVRPFLMNFVSLNTSSLINKFLNFLLFIFLVRFLAVNDYGVYTLVWAHIGLLMPLADFGTTTFGITQLSNTDIAFNDLFSFRLIQGIIVGVIAVILAMTTHLTQGNGLLLIAAVMLANSVSGSLLILLTNLSRSYLTSVISVIFNTIMILLTIIALVLYKNLSLAFLIIAVSYFVYGFVNLIYLKKYYKNLSVFIRPEYWKKIVGYSFIFLLLSFFAGIYFKIDVFILNRLKGTEAVGIYSAGYKFFEALLFIASSYTIAATPVIQKMIKENKEETLKRLLRDSKLLFSFGLSSAIILALAAPAILPVLLHGAYNQAVGVFQIVIFALPFMLVSTVYMSVLFILKKTPHILGLFISQALLNMLLNFLYVPRYSYYASSVFTVLAEIINVAAVIILVKKVYADIS